jgi:hypothetical protein
MVYDAPELPSGIFDDFIKLGAEFKQSTVSEYIVSSSQHLAAGPPTRTQSQPASIVNYNMDLMNWIVNVTVVCVF